MLCGDGSEKGGELLSDATCMEGPLVFGGGEGNDVLSPTVAAGIVVIGGSDAAAKTVLTMLMPPSNISSQ